MQPKIRYILIPLALGILGLGVYLGYGVWVSGDEVAWRSCTLSVAEGIRRADRAGEIVEAGTEWRVLGKEETARISELIGKDKGFDCYQLFSRPDGRSRIPDEIEIRARRNDRGELELSVTRISDF